MTKTRQWVLKSHPVGRTTKEDFELSEIDLPPLEDGQILIKNEFISVDPYMRGRISKTKSSYAQNVQSGETVGAGTVGLVVESKSPAFQPGDYVSVYSAWQEHAIVKAESARKVDPSLGPLSYNLGALGMTGLTAYFGLLDVGALKKGETVLVSAAVGAVGSIVGQIAKIYGCHVVGTTSSDEKVALAKSLGYDEVINYKTTPNLFEAIKAACPKGIDVYFDNVGGETLEIAVKLLNPRGRIPLCGGISDYDNVDLGQLPKGPNLTRLIGIQGKIEGFLVSSFLSKWGEGLKNLAQWVKEGKIQSKETTFEGFEKIPEAFISLFEGSNIGKVVVKLN